MKLKFALAFAIALLVASNLAAQKQKKSTPKNDESDIEQMERQFEEMQRRMMEQFKNGSAFDLFKPFSLDSTGNSFFRWDTTITLDGGSGSSHFFQFGFPDGADSTGGNPQSFFKHFFDFGQQGEQQGESPEGSEFLDENGSEDGLLPEEKLRQQESDEPQPAEKKEKTAPADKPKTKRKTVRI